MDKDIKKYVDQGDIATLRYVFSQSLDIDPLFDDYSEEYDYCVRKGVFETHLEDGFTPMTNDESRWDKSYWTKLCLDLEKNLSKKRLDHMRDVARVVYADKIKRLKESKPEIVNDSEINRSNIDDNSNNDKIQTKSSREALNAKLRADRAKQDADVEREKKKLAREREQDLEQERKERSTSSSVNNGDTKSKKAFGDSMQKGKKNQGMNWVAITVGIVILGTIAYLVKR